MIKTVLIIISFLGVIYSIYLNFSHPDLTRTRMLITFWKEYLLSAIAIIPGLYLLMLEDKS